MSDLLDKRVLIIDDDPDMSELVAFFLSQAGAEIYTAAGGPEGLRQFFAHRPDLVILDIMMPEMDGWEVCQRIRQVSDVPLILLTALARNPEIVKGLKCGADDYLPKPFSPDVLLARAQAVLRRAHHYSAQEKSVTYNDGHLAVDLIKRRVRVRGEPVKLSATECRLLTYLFRHAGRVLTFEQILAQVWGKACQDNPEYVHVYVSRLRQKLEPEPKQPIYFLTEHGIGYRFEKHATPQRI